MNKRGFTLIELLAVIVILAIIAVIAVSIVLNIIDESKKNAGLRSAEMYVKAAEMSIAQSTLKDKNITDGTYNLKDGDICLNDDCTDKLDVEVNGKVPESGTITITNENISDLSIVLNEKTIIKNSDGDLVYQTGEKIKTIDDICTHDTTNGIAPKTAGAKYTCEVKEGTTYTFYVLNATSTEVNLIMDQNINSDGTPAGMTGTTKNGDNVYNLVAWNNESGQSTNAYGPVTAMQFLYNATKDWTNIDPVNYTYNDKTTQGTTAENKSYTSFISTNGVATITPLTGDGVTIGSEATPLRARMPIFARDASITEVTSKTDANAYLYDNLDPNGLNAPYGYWTLSSYADSSLGAWCVTYHGKVYSNGVDVGSGYGVRAVITLKI